MSPWTSKNSFPRTAIMITTTATMIFAKTDPTPFVAAFFTSYVITAIILPCLNFAIWTRFYISIFSCPGIKFIITYICTPDSSMCNTSTFHAYFLTTLTFRCLTKNSLFSYILSASVSWTPSKVWIEVNINVNLKSYVLFENFFRTKSLDV